MSLLYSVLAFAEVMVLFASVLCLFAFAIGRVISKINRFFDKAVDATSTRAEQVAQPQVAVSVGVVSRNHKVRGGHNDSF